MKRIFTILTISLICLGCFAKNPLFAKDAGPVITKSYDFKDFNSLKISSAFDVELVKSNKYSVIVQVSQTYEEDLKVILTDKTVNISLKGKFHSMNNAIRKVTITMPELYMLDLSGASTLVSSSTFDCGMKRFLMAVSGASNVTVTVNAVDAVLDVTGASKIEMHGAISEFEIELSGASKADLNITASEADVKISGASTMDLKGSAEQFEAEVSGASRLFASEFPADFVDLECSGASNSQINVNKKFEVELSGASKCTYKTNNSVMITPEVRGGSSLKRL